MDAVCDVFSCGRKGQAKKDGSRLCLTHFRRKRREDLDWDKPILERTRQGAECLVNGCSLAPVAKNLCPKHYDRLKRGADLEAVSGESYQKQGLTCSHGTCTRRPIAKNLCPLHYNRKRAGTDLDRPYTKPGSVPVCTVRSCKERHLSRGFCVKHYHQATKYNLTPDQIEKLDRGVCDLCGGADVSGKRLSVDHDHKCCPGEKSCGQCIRGFLCSPCNQSLGLLRDDPDLIRRAAEYVERNYLGQ